MDKYEVLDLLEQYEEIKEQLINAWYEIPEDERTQKARNNADCDILDELIEEIKNYFE